MSTSRSRLLASAVTVSLLLLGVALFLSREQVGGDSELQPAAPQDVGSPAQSTWPSPTEADAASREVGDPRPGGVESLSPSDEEPTEEPASRGTPGLSGRLMSSDGTPVAKGRVWYVPSLLSLLDRLPQPRDVGEMLYQFPQATTDSAGRFSLSLPEVTVNEGASAFDEWLPTLVGLAEGHAMGAIEIAEPLRSQRDVGDLVLGYGTTARGVVLTEEGGTIAGAVVMPRFGRMPPQEKPAESDREDRVSAERFMARRTDSAGRFALPGIPYGRPIRLMAEAPGFLPTELEVGAVEREEGAQGLEIVLHRGMRLVVSVQDRRGAAIADARVFAMPHAEVELPSSMWRRLDEVHRMGAPGVRDANGNFIIDGLVQSDYDVFAEAPGHEPARLQASVTPAAAVAVVVLAPEAVSRVRVIDEATREPVASAIIEAWTFVQGGIFEPPLSLQVDALGEGEFVVHGIGEIKTELHVRAPGHAARLETMGGAQPGTTVELVVPLGIEGTIHGSMTTVGGNPLAGVTIHASMQAPNPLGGGSESSGLEAVTGPTGEYLIAGVGRGSWKLRATLAKHVTVTETITVAKDGERTEWSRVLFPGATIVGVKKFSNGRLMPGDSVSARLIASDPQAQGEGMKTWHNTTTGAQAEFTLRDLAPGTWEVGGTDGVTIGVKPGETKSVEVVRATPPILVGRVIGDGGASVPARVVARKIKGHLQWRGQTTSGGDYELMVQPGDYWLHAQCLDVSLGCTEMEKVTCDDEQVIRVELHVGRCLLTGACVSASDGKPVAGAQVLLDHVGLGHAQLLLTNEHGRFELRAAPGQYVLRASAEGYAPAEVELDVSSGATSAAVDLVLIPQ